MASLLFTINEKEQELAKFRRMSSEPERDDNARDKKITKLKYMVSRLDERLKATRAEIESVKQELTRERDSCKSVDKKAKILEVENSDLKFKTSSLRVKLGVVTANYNVAKHEINELIKNQQDKQIQISRLEERLTIAIVERERLKGPLIPEGTEDIKRRLDSEKKDSRKLRKKLETLECLREADQDRIDDKEVENRLMAAELSRYSNIVANLETSLHMSDMTSQAERESREDYEKQNEVLRTENEQHKMRLGISQVRLNKYRNNFTMELNPSRSYDKPNISGWYSNKNMSNVDRFGPRSIGSSAESQSTTQGSASTKTSSGKRGRISTTTIVCE